MQYSQINVGLSVYRHIADQLLAAGYDVHWFADGSTETQTAGLPSALATITLVDAVPANPTSIVRLTEGMTAQAHEIPVPAFAIEVGRRRQLRRLGLGDSTFEWERPVRIEGFCDTPIQHRVLPDLFEDWLKGQDTRLPAWDFVANGANPPRLEDFIVQFTDVGTQELTAGDEATRYYVQIMTFLRYFE